MAQADAITDDDLEWDRWMSLTDAEQEAEVEREVAAYNRWYESLTLAGQIAHSRQGALGNCRSTRKLIRHPNCPEIIREDARGRLKAAQVRLLKIRIWRATGSRPGSA